ncbi:MAG TPA: tRNA (N6-threonylcarbamoyladenosine(37)-N6)-methyltransferase TrmO [Ignavibacteria bacterium]|nr:tRNA (N6-threonylcarbamoyladenosine(37)-N6)-methyltransferase TrmO [Ignavibacteria bacterium]
MKIEIKPIGFVKNSRNEVSDDFWGNVISEIHLSDEFSPDALQGITDFSHAEIIFYFDKADESKVNKGLRHPRDNKNWPLTGIFAMRAKDRPNHLGNTIVKILRTEGNVLFIQGLDAIDNTPVVDIKPVIKEFLPREEVNQPAWVSELMKDYWK